MPESKLKDLSMDFAVRTIKLCSNIKGHYALTNQLELFVKAELLEREAAADLYNECGTIRRILIKSINTAKENMN